MTQRFIPSATLLLGGFAAIADESACNDTDLKHGDATPAHRFIGFMLGLLRRTCTFIANVKFCAKFFSPIAYAA